MFLPFASIESWDAKNVLVLFRLLRAKTDFLEERCSPLLFLSPLFFSLSLSCEKQKDRNGGNALIRFIPSSHRLWSYFPEISLLGTSSPRFFIPLLTALFYLKSISFLAKPFKPLRPTFNAIRNTFSHLWRIRKYDFSFFSKEMLNKQIESNFINRLRYVPRFINPSLRYWLLHADFFVYINIVSYMVESRIKGIRE